MANPLITQNLQATILGYSNALAQDAITAYPNYILDGEEWDRDSWRKELEERIVAINKTINAMNPYVIRTKHVL